MTKAHDPYKTSVVLSYVRAFGPDLLKSVGSKNAADKLVQNIRRKTARCYWLEKKVRIILAGLRGQESIAALCHREGIADSPYYK